MNSYEMERKCIEYVDRINTVSKLTYECRIECMNGYELRVKDDAGNVLYDAQFEHVGALYWFLRGIVHAVCA